MKARKKRYKISRIPKKLKIALLFSEADPKKINTIFQNLTQYAEASFRLNDIPSVSRIGCYARLADYFLAKVINCDPLDIVKEQCSNRSNKAENPYEFLSRVYTRSGAVAPKELREIFPRDIREIDPALYKALEYWQRVHPEIVSNAQKFGAVQIAEPKPNRSRAIRTRRKVVGRKVDLGG